MTLQLLLLRFFYLMIMITIIPPIVAAFKPVVEAWSLLPSRIGGRYGGIPSSAPSPTTTTTITNENHGHRHRHDGHDVQNEFDRRRFFSQVVANSLSTTTTAAAATVIMLQLQQRPCYAACLPGDTRTECIGVYKVPIDDNVLPYVGSPEALKKFAPDLKYVPPISVPKSPQQAIEILQTQRLASKDIKDVVSSGKLEEAGIKVLNLIPKITTAGRVVLASVREQQQQQQLRTSSTTTNTNLDVVNELQYSQLEGLFNDMVGLWSECDIVIGQGLRGQLGVSAVAQIQILESIKDASIAFDDFLLSSEKILNIPAQKL